MHRFLDEPDVAGFAALFGATVVKAAVDDVLREVRSRAVRAAAPVPAFDGLLAEVRGRLARLESEGLAEVLNGTGILLHTNLGRAPLALEAIAAMTAVGAGYSNLEYDLPEGTRGSRHARVSALVRATTGAQDALVVNNCAAAVLLILDTFAKGREVVVSRNQLVEIGGGFRLPEVLARSGATLVEVGATNKVYLRDFERALTTQTALLMRSHTSNYRIEGFTADVDARDLAALGRRAGIPTVEDLGGGALVDLRTFGLPHERTVQEAIGDGIDLVAFSGDKLLGGPQCGIVAGSSAAIARLRANPLLRALRVDKVTLAALGATLRLYLEPEGFARIPFYAMLGASAASLTARANTLLAEHPVAVGAQMTVVATEAYAGGGAVPMATLPSIGLALHPALVRPGELSAALRSSRPPLVARTTADAVIVDLRTIPPARDADVSRMLARALAPG
jgi:L-seryl-tRNA(Ser) seleniumtransferase